MRSDKIVMLRNHSTTTTTTMHTRTREHRDERTRKNGRLCYVTFAIVVITWNRSSSGALTYTLAHASVFIYTTPYTQSTLGIESFTDTQITTRTTTTTKHWNKKPDLATEPHINTTSAPCQWVCMCLAGYVDIVFCHAHQYTPALSRYECGE